MAPYSALAELKEECSRCTGCGLSKSRANVVFGSGDPDSGMVILGEGPGEQEDLLGLPFIGQAGKLLNKALETHGVSRDQIYICNTVKCRACDLDDKGKRNRPPTAEEMAVCRPWLDRQLEILTPRVILCLGASAARAFIYGDFQMNKCRGSWLETTENGAEVMITWHPAYVLRKGGVKSGVVWDQLVGDLGQCMAMAGLTTR